MGLGIRRRCRELRRSTFERGSRIESRAFGSRILSDADAERRGEGSREGLERRGRFSLACVVLRPDG